MRDDAAAHSSPAPEALNAAAIRAPFPKEPDCEQEDWLGQGETENDRAQGLKGKDGAQISEAPHALKALPLTILSGFALYAHHAGQSRDWSPTAIGSRTRFRGA